MKKVGETSRGKQIDLTDEMIELRNRLCDSLGFIIRQPCTMRGEGHKLSHRTCIEKPALTYEYEGKMCSPYHMSAVFEERGVMMHQWPDEVIDAAEAVEKGKKKRAPIPAEVSK